jgi:hypothetical protein
MSRDEREGFFIAEEAAHEHNRTRTWLRQRYGVGAAFPPRKTKKKQE